MRIFLCFLILLTSLPILGQSSGVVRGKVFDEKTGQPIISANVILDNGEVGTTTDIDGFFSINKVRSGPQTLMITYLGFDTLSYDFVLNEGQILFKNFTLTESSIELGTINISAARQTARTEVQISKISIGAKEILKLPSIGGEADIAQYLQLIPGIISTGDQGGQIFIRGGSPIQNKVLLDGLTIYNPFHSIGFFSVFETELIRNVDVYTGGFSAEYGGRISAIVDITTRDGNKKRIGGQVAANPFLYKAYIEGPLVKYRDGGGSTSFVFSSKNSIIDRTADQIYPHASFNDTIGLPFEFNDLYGKLSFANQNGSQLNLFGFNFRDRYKNPEIADLNWNNSGGGADFKLIPGNSNFILNGMMGYTDYQINLNETDGTPRQSSIRGFTALIDFNFFSNKSELNYGIEFNSFNTTFTFQNPFKVILGQDQNTTEIAGFAKYRYVLSKLVLEASFRLQYYASLGEFSPEPRLAIKYNITDYLRLKFAGGIYSQNLLSASNERDVVNLFTGFLSGPEEQIFDLGSNTVSNKNIQTANHLVGGVEFDASKNLRFNVEAYYKDFSQLIVVNRNKLRGSDPNFSTEEGSAYGFDVALDYNLGRFALTANYALGYVLRFDGEQTYAPVFDRRHNVNVLGSYSFGANASWDASIRWNMGSGFPFTRTQGFYNLNPFSNGLGTNYAQENPESIGILYEEQRNLGRLPFYHRLDASVSKTIAFSENQNLVVDASVTNIYNRRNIFYFDRLTYNRVNQLPILPSIGLKFNF